MEIEFNNPPKDIAKRASCGIKSPHYEIRIYFIMMLKKCQDSIIVDHVTA